jgi:hypothetical protein
VTHALLIPLNIHPDLLALRQWVGWRMEMNEDGKPTKRPYNPKNGRLADATDPDDWDEFNAAVAGAKRFGLHGVGCCFSDDDAFTGIDIDNCRNPETGVIAGWAQAIINQCASYTEISPSGTGVHIWVRGNLPSGSRCVFRTAFGKVEIYSRERYFTVTGIHLAGTPQTINERQAALETVYANLLAQLKTPPKPKSTTVNGTATSAAPNLDDTDLLRKIRSSQQAPKFNALWAGDISAYDNDDSRADLALCSILVFWTGPHPDRIDRLFRQSGLMRDKWLRDDYRNRTIQHAVDNCDEFYKQPAASSSRNGHSSNVQEPLGETFHAAVTDDWDYMPLESLPIERMPPDLLPGALGAMVEAVAVATETPRELATMMALGVVALSIAGKVEVAPTDNPDYIETTNLYCCAAMESGNRKSSVLNFLTEPVVDWEANQAANFPYRDDLKSERKTIEQQIENLRKRKRGKDEPIEALQAEIKDLEKKLPVIPVVPQLWAQDVTPEHLGTLMAEQGGRLALLSSEGGFIENFAGRYSKNSTAPNIDLVLQSYDGSPAKIDRAGRLVHLARPVLTIAIAPQPDVLAQFSKHPEFRSRGFIGRFMYAMPPSPLGERTGVTLQIPSYVRREWREQITKLLDMPINRNTFGRIDPVVLSLTKPARDLWKDFEATTERQMREDGRLSECRDWAAKLPGKAARLAANLYAMTYQWSDRPTEIQIEQVETAIRLSQIFTSDALAVFGLMRIDETVAQAVKVASWLKEQGRELFSFREAFQRFQRKFERADKMRPCLALLTEHGYIQALGKEAGKKTEMYRVHPRVLGFVD